jgi:hypothetical protein
MKKNNRLFLFRISIVLLFFPLNQSFSQIKVTPIEFTTNIELISIDSVNNQLAVIGREYGSGNVCTLSIFTIKNNLPRKILSFEDCNKDIFQSNNEMFIIQHINYPESCLLSSIIIDSTEPQKVYLDTIHGIINDIYSRSDTIIIGGSFKMSINNISNFCYLVDGNWHGIELNDPNSVTQIKPFHDGILVLQSNSVKDTSKYSIISIFYMNGLKQKILTSNYLIIKLSSSNKSVFFEGYDFRENVFSEKGVFEINQYGKINNLTSQYSDSFNVIRHAVYGEQILIVLGSKRNRNEKMILLYDPLSKKRKVFKLRFTGNIFDILTINKNIYFYGNIKILGTKYDIILLQIEDY